MNSDFKKGEIARFKREDTSIDPRYRGSLVLVVDGKIQHDDYGDGDRIKLEPIDRSLGSWRGSDIRLRDIEKVIPKPKRNSL